MRYTDLLVNGHWRHPLTRERAPKAQAEFIRDGLYRYTVIDATNVYEYVAGLGESDLYELPCGAPPHVLLYVEWRQHNGKGILLHAVSADRREGGPFLIGNQVPDGRHTGANGFKVLRHPNQPFCQLCLDGNHDACIERYWLTRQHRPCGCSCWSTGITQMWLSDHLPDQAAWNKVRWVWTVDMWQEDFGEVYGPLSCTRAALDEWGRLIDVTYEINIEPDGEALQMLSLHPFAVFLHTLNFMQCANIRTEYIQPSDKLSRSLRKKGRIKDKLVGYHVLRIASSGPATKERSSGNGSSNLVAFHPVRGEFHHYGDCCPGLHPPKGLLFGKHTGRFWVPAHVRGNPERGTVTQSFEMKPVTEVPWNQEQS